MPDYVGDLQQLVTGYVEGGGLRVYLKTNYGPEIPLYTGKSKDSGSSLPSVDLGISDAIARAIGFKAQVIVRDAKGKTIAKYGPESPTDWVRVAVALSLLGLVGFLIVRRWM